MPIWYPPPEIGKKELVGRRLLYKAGTERPTNEDGGPMLEAGDFYETRAEANLSVDRLGDPNPSRDTLRAITSLADTEVSRSETNRVFNGWATIRVQDFRFTGWAAQIISTPKVREDGTVENPWHADVNRDGFREKAQAYALALALQHTFERKGAYEPPNRSLATK